MIEKKKKKNTTYSVSGLAKYVADTNNETISSRISQRSKTKTERYIHQTLNSVRIRLFLIKMAVFLKFYLLKNSK